MGTDAILHVKYRLATTVRGEATVQPVFLTAFNAPLGPTALNVTRSRCGMDLFVLRIVQPLKDATIAIFQDQT